MFQILKDIQIGTLQERRDIWNSIIQMIYSAWRTIGGFQGEKGRSRSAAVRQFIPQGTKVFPIPDFPPPPKTSSGRLKGDFGTDNLPDLQLGDTHTIGTHRLLRDDQNLIIFYRLQVQRISSLQTCWYGDFLDYPGCGLSCSSRACRLTEGQHFWGKFPAED